MSVPAVMIISFSHSQLINTPRRLSIQSDCRLEAPAFHWRDLLPQAPLSAMAFSMSKMRDVGRNLD